MRILVFLALALLGCGGPPPEPCLAAEDILTWQLRTNPGVLRTSLPPDRCGRYTEVRSDLGPGGRVAASRELSLAAPATVELDSGGESTCGARFEVRIGAEAAVGTSARFSLLPGRHVAEVAAEVPEPCGIRLRPRLEVQ